LPINSSLRETLPIQAIHVDHPSADPQTQPGRACMTPCDHTSSPNTPRHTIPPHKVAYPHRLAYILHRNP
jgi:hypothetical protein